MNVYEDFCQIYGEPPQSQTDKYLALCVIRHALVSSETEHELIYHVISGCGERGVTANVVMNVRRWLKHHAVEL